MTCTSVCFVEIERWRVATTATTTNLDERFAFLTFSFLPSFLVFSTDTTIEMGIGSIPKAAKRGRRVMKYEHAEPSKLGKRFSTVTICATNVNLDITVMGRQVRERIVVKTQANTHICEMSCNHPIDSSSHRSSQNNCIRKIKRFVSRLWIH